MKSMCPPRTAFNRRFLFSALPNRRRRHPTALRERRGEKKYYIYIKKKKEYWAPSWLPSGTRERVELFRKEINKRRKRLATLLRCRRIEWLGRYRRHMARHSTRRPKKQFKWRGSARVAASGGKWRFEYYSPAPRQFSNRIQPDPYTTAAPQPDINNQTTTHLALNTLRPTERGRASHHTLYDWYFSISIFFFLFLFFSSSTSNKKKGGKFHCCLTVRVGQMCVEDGPPSP